MLARAIAAFVALPGTFAFALPLTIGISTGRPLRHKPIPYRLIERIVRLGVKQNLAKATAKSKKGRSS
jgi:hypothetical protein